jgi:hypothetical protein
MRLKVLVREVEHTPAKLTDASRPFPAARQSKASATSQVPTAEIAVKAFRRAKAEQWKQISAGAKIIVVTARAAQSWAPANQNSQGGLTVSMSHKLIL